MTDFIGAVKRAQDTLIFIACGHPCAFSWIFFNVVMIVKSDAGWNQGFTFGCHRARKMDLTG